MNNKLSIKDYALLKGTTTSNVYQKIKSGSLKYETIEGKKFIILESGPVTNDCNKYKVKNKVLKEKLKHSREIIELQNKEVDILNEVIKSLNASLYNTNMLLENHTRLLEKPIEDIEIIKPKKKKKKKK